MINFNKLWLKWIFRILFCSECMLQNRYFELLRISEKWLQKFHKEKKKLFISFYLVVIFRNNWFVTFWVCFVSIIDLYYQTKINLCFLIWPYIFNYIVGIKNNLLKNQEWEFEQNFNLTRIRYKSYYINFNLLSFITVLVQFLF